MNRKIKILFITSVLIITFSFSETTYAENPQVTNYKLNGKEESIKLNPSRGDVVSIEINTDVLVKFSRIYICKTEDSVCDDESSLIYFTKTNDPYISSVVKTWDGKPSDTKKSRGVVVSDGDYKIKVKMKDEMSSEYKYIQELFPYIITIDSNFFGSFSGSSSSSESSSSQSSSASSSTSNSGSFSLISTHSSVEELSVSSKSSMRFEVSSGRDRLAYSGAPIVFDGEVSVPKDLYGQSVKLIWSFGDGFSAEGKKISHTYKFAGDYVVVLNASLSDLFAVSRTSVKVVSPSVVISNVSSDSVEVWNKGSFEINLNGWLISNDRGKFIFPLDTIIGPNKKITVPDEYMKLSLAQGGKVFLLNPSQKEVSAFDYGTGAGSSSPILAINFSDLDNDPVVKKIREFIVKEGKSSVGNKTISISKNSSSRQVEGAFIVDPKKSITENKKVGDFENDKIISSSAQVATVASSQVSPRGFIRSLFSLPYSGFNFIKRIFYSDN